MIQGAAGYARQGSARPNKAPQKMLLSELVGTVSDRVTYDGHPQVQGVLPLLLVGEREHRLYVLSPEKINYIESHGNYVKIHASGAEYICRDSIKRLAPLLRLHGFLRIERSILINIRAILFVQRAERSTYMFTLVCGSTVNSGATYRREILRILPLNQERSRGGVNDA